MELKAEYMKNLENNLVSAIEKFEDKSDIASLILTGSLGRNEGTFHIDASTGKLVLDSDVEVAIVFKPGHKDSAKKLKEYLIENFSEEMNPMTISLTRVKNRHNFNYSILKPKYNSIFMYDLYNGSKTIWGIDLIKDSESKYDLYEAKRVVANRIGELTFTKNNPDHTSKQITQWEAKLLLALGTAYCIMNKSYKSAYSKQYEFIVNNNEQTDSLVGTGFTADYTQAYSYLRLGGNIYNVDSDKLHEYVKNISNAMKHKDYNKPKINSFSRKLKYMIACVLKKVPLNPLSCETEILDRLIICFAEKNTDIDKYSRYWKNVIY